LTIKRRFWVSYKGLVYYLKTLHNYINLIALLNYLLLEVVKCAFKLVIILLTYIFIRLFNLLLYIRSNNIYFPIAKMQAKTNINSLLLSCLFLVICLKFNVSLAIILFNWQLKLIINPFLLKLYMFSTIIWYFSIIIAT